MARAFYVSSFRDRGADFAIFLFVDLDSKVFLFYFDTVAV